MDTEIPDTTVLNSIVNEIIKDENKTFERVATLPAYHDEVKFDALFKLAKLEYPDELDYIIHMALLSSLLEEDKLK